jgi:hypothetical protein
MKKTDNITCKKLAEELTVEGGLKFNAMTIGRIRAKVCDESDIEGKEIKPSGVVKICQYLDTELKDRQEAKTEIAQCQVLHQKNTNPRIIVAKDLETKKRCLVSIPIKRKKLLNVPNKHIKCERKAKDGKYQYRWAG